MVQTTLPDVTRCLPQQMNKHIPLPDMETDGVYFEIRPHQHYSSPDAYDQDTA